MGVDDNPLYTQGTSTAEEYLHKAWMGMKMHRKFEPQTLRCHKQVYIGDKAPEFQAGFMDAIGALILSSLDGVMVDLFRWDVLHVLARVNKQK